MKNELKTFSPLTKEQERFLKTVLTHLQKKDLRTRFPLLGEENERCIIIEKAQINVKLKDTALLELPRLGYVSIRTNPTSTIEFLPKIFELDLKAKEEEASSRDLQVFHINIIQVYAWLAASLLAALFSLFLLWLTFQQILAKSISTSVASAFLTMMTSLLTAVFFKNYDKANDRLKEHQAQISDGKKVLPENKPNDSQEADQAPISDDKKALPGNKPGE